MSEAEKTTNETASPDEGQAKEPTKDVVDPLEDLKLIYEATAAVTAAAEEVRVAESNLEHRKAVHKSAVKFWEAAVARQQEVIRECREGRSPGPLFEQQKAAADASVTQEELALKTPIAELELSDTIKLKLEEAGLTTVGDIAKHTRSGQPLTKIKGIGPAKAEEILNALSTFWQAKSVAEAEAAPNVLRERMPDAEWRAVNLTTIVGHNPVLTEMLARKYPEIVTVNDLCNVLVEYHEDKPRTETNLWDAFELPMDLMESFALALDEACQTVGEGLRSTITREMLAFPGEKIEPATEAPKPKRTRKPKASAPLQATA